MKKYIFLTLLAVLLADSILADCYLTLDTQKLPHEEFIKQVALIEISKYLEPVTEAPPIGLKADDCEYKLTISEISDRIFLILKGPKISSYADSKLKDLDGFKQALFRIILQEKSGDREKICRAHKEILVDECSKNGALNTETIQTKTGEQSNDLTWQEDEAGRMPWKKAVAYCSNLTLNDYSDWRLPTKDELERLKLIQNRFPNFEKYYYWSSTLNEEYGDYAWGYNASTSSLFDDGWIKNHYSVKCVRSTSGKQSSTAPAIVTVQVPVIEDRDEDTTLEPETIEEEEEVDHTFGWKFVVAPTYMAGFYDVIDIYINNIEEKGEDIEEQNYITIAIAFIPYYQLDSGLRLGAGLGPSAYLAIEENDETVDFMMTPVSIHAGYTFDSGLYLRGGLSLLNATGDYVDSQNLGLLGAIGLEIRRKKMISFGFETGFDSASVELKKYDCSNITNVTSLSDCDKSKETVYPIGLMASFHVIF